MQPISPLLTKADRDKGKKDKTISMTYYDLSNDPNFIIEAQPETVAYRFHFQYIRGLMYVTIELTDGTRVAGPVRVCNGEWLIPYMAYSPDGGGNCRVVDDEGQYPMFDRFSSHGRLEYYTFEELFADGD